MYNSNKPCDGGMGCGDIYGCEFNTRSIALAPIFLLPPTTATGGFDL